MPPLDDHTTHTVFPTMTGGFGSGALYGAVAVMIPVAGSIRSSVPVPNVYSEPSPLASEAWSNVCWSISAAPQGPPAMRVPGVVCSGEDEVTGGEEDTVGDDTEDDAGADADRRRRVVVRVGQHRDAGARAGDDDHGRRGQDRRKGAAQAQAAAPRAGLPALGLTTEPRLADQAVRDLLDGHPARRLGSDPVQHVG